MFSPEVLNLFFLLNLFSLSPEKNCQALHRCHNIFKKSNFFLFRRQLAAAKKMVVLVSLDAQDSSLERNTVINETLKKSERETSWKEKNKVKSEVKIPKLFSCLREREREREWVCSLISLQEPNTALEGPSYRKEDDRKSLEAFFTWKWGLETHLAICLKSGSWILTNCAGSITSKISSISPRNITWKNYLEQP